MLMNEGEKKRERNRNKGKKVDNGLPSGCVDVVVCEFVEYENRRG